MILWFKLYPFWSASANRACQDDAGRPLIQQILLHKGCINFELGGGCVWEEGVLQLRLWGYSTHGFPPQKKKTYKARGVILQHSLLPIVFFIGTMHLFATLDETVTKLTSFLSLLQLYVVSTNSMPCHKLQIF